MIVFILRELEYRSKDVMLRLHQMLRRPDLEFCKQFWIPYLRKDMIAVERVQRRFAIIILGMIGLMYVHLKALALDSLVFRKMKGCLNEPNQIMRCLNRVDVVGCYL